MFIQALEGIGVSKPICRRIATMLGSRAIHSSIGSNSLVRYATRGTPKGGVLLPLLWLLVINSILLKIKGIRVKVVTYADDVVILCSGLFTSTIRERVGIALRMLSGWAKDCGLGVNPDKTELILFTRKLKIEPFETPLHEGKRLTLYSLNIWGSCWIRGVR